MLSAERSRAAGVLAIFLTSWRSSYFIQYPESEAHTLRLCTLAPLGSPRLPKWFEGQVSPKAFSRGAPSALCHPWRLTNSLKLLPWTSHGNVPDSRPPGRHGGTNQAFRSQGPQGDPSLVNESHRSQMPAARPRAFRGIWALPGRDGCFRPHFTENKTESRRHCLIFVRLCS